MKSVFSAIIKKVLCSLSSLYEFHQQSSLDTIFLMSNIFSAHTEKTDFSDFRVIRAMRCNTLAKSQLFFKDGNDRFHGFHGNMNIICCEFASCSVHFNQNGNMLDLVAVFQLFLGPFQDAIMTRIAFPTLASAAK